MARSAHVLTSFIVVSLFCATIEAQEANWPQWGGPDRTGISKETGLLKTWPQGGPKRVWLYEDCGTGFGGPAIVGGRIYIMGARGQEDFLLCLDEAKGTEIWHAPMSGVVKSDFAEGSRGTPTVADGHVYALSGAGTLVCVRASDGKEVWRRTMQELGGEVPKWEYCESVLVDGNRVVCTPGGPQGAIVAFDKSNGRLLWQVKELDDLAHYSSIVRAEIHGKQQYVQLFEKRVVGLSPEDGKLLWQHPFNGQVAVITTPIVHDNQVFITAGYGVGCKLIEISASNKTKEVYDNNVMKNHHGGVVLVGEHLYGFSDDIGWTCMEFKTGRRVWRDRESLGKGALTYAEGKLYCVSEGDGSAPTDVMLIEASPGELLELGKFKLSPQTKLRKTNGRVWTHPVVAGGKLYLRDQELLFCYDVKAK